MWTSPVPYSTLTEAKLIQRECTRPDNVFKDLLVCRSNYRLSKAETETEPVAGPHYQPAV